MKNKLKLTCISNEELSYINGGKNVCCSCTCSCNCKSEVDLASGQHGNETTNSSSVSGNNNPPIVPPPTD